MIGRAGEDAAAEYLKKKAYTVLATNYATCGFELDIVAYKRGTLVFAEVKTRSGDAFGTPADAVDDIKRRRIKAAADGFIREQVRFGSVPVWSRLFRRMREKPVKAVRYDVIEVYVTRIGEVEKINLIENMFT